MVFPTRWLPLRYPPFALIILSAAQIAMFTEGTGRPPQAGLHLPRERSLERFVAPTLSALFSHADITHLVNNAVAQIALGAPLEGVHGALRFVTVYLASGFGGTLVYRAGWILRPEPAHVVYVGASAAVYGIVGAYGAHLAINWAELYFRWLWLLGVAALLASEAALAATAAEQQSHTTIAYSAHVGGGMYGALLGVLVLRNARVLVCEQKLRIVCTLILCIGSAALLSS